MYCDEGTMFSYFHSWYQSGIDPIHGGTTVDTFGKKTPRTLDNLDFIEGFDHILAFDLNTGKVIDFFSPLNMFYGGAFESYPTITFY